MKKNKRHIFLAFQSISLILLLFTNSFGKEYLIQPSIGEYAVLSGNQKQKTINGEVFFNPAQTEQSRILASNRVLLQMTLKDSAFETELTQNEINAIEVEINDVNELINSLDFEGQFNSFLYGVVTVDAKAYFDLTWSLVSGALRERYGDKLVEGSWKKFFMDSAEQGCRAAVDIAFEYCNKKYGFNTSLFAKIIPSAIGDFFGYFTASYNGILSTAKLINAIKGIIELPAVQRAQYKNSLSFDFIYDYVTYYHGDIHKMKNEIISKIDSDSNIKIETFWSVWYYYMLNRATLRGSQIFETDIAPAPGVTPNPIRLQVVAEAARLSLDYIEKYGNGGIFRVKAKQDIVTTGTGAVLKRYLTKPVVDLDRKLYFMPINPVVKTGPSMNIGWGRLMGDYYDISDLNILIYYKPSYFLLDYITEYNKNLYYKKIDETDEKVYIREIKGLTIHAKISNSSEVLENRELSIKNFYLPGFLEDIDENYWAKDYIFSLYQKDIINGYKDGTFKPKEKISNGEIIKMATRAILYEKYKNTINKYKDINGISFSKYVNFLEKDLSINTSLLDGTNIFSLLKNSETLESAAEALKRKATRGYVAKIARNLVSYRDLKPEKLVSCGIKDTKGWDECSTPLRDECIVHGDNNKDYNPEDPITRDEVSKIIYRAMKYSLENTQWCDEDSVSTAQ
ncbi:MAG: S-layer homology domain-containing protein [Candidatus Electrothrix scaldis]|nr:MAG: S-layer homology domain-containing protein [Candidatus Electrothrix sp. GW3-3]